MAPRKKAPKRKIAPFYTAKTPSKMEYAGFWRRFAALLIDGILLSVLFLPLIFILAFAGAVVAIVVWYFLFIIFSVWYEVYFIGKYGATYGKKWMDLKVVSEKGQLIGYKGAFIRWIGRLIVGFTFFIGYLLILFTERKQGLHDKIAGTVVVNGKTEFDDKYY